MYRSHEIIAIGRMHLFKTGKLIPSITEGFKARDLFFRQSTHLRNLHVPDHMLR